MKNKRDLIVNGNIMKAIIYISLPLMINNFVISAYDIIDAIFVSKIGQIELAVVAFVGPIYQMIVAASVGLSIAGTSLIGYSVGGEDYQKANKTITHLLITSMVSGVVFTVGLFFLSSYIMDLASATKNIILKGDSYFKILILSIPFVFFNAFYIAVKRGFGETVHIMNIQFSSMIVKVILSYYLIVVMKRGINALAITTLAGNAVMAGYAVIDMYVKNKKPELRIKPSKLSVSIFWSIIILSLPIILEKASASFSFVLINERVLVYGETVLAAYGITNRINSLFFRTITGLGSGLATIVSQNLGANKLKRVKKAIRCSMFVGIGFATVFLGMIFLIAPMFADILAGKGSELFGHIMNAINGYSSTVIPWAIIQVVIGVFIGVSKTKYNLLITMMRIYAFRIPCIIILTTYTQLNEFSIWYGMLISNILTAVFAIVLLKTSINRILYKHDNVISTV